MSQIYTKEELKQIVEALELSKEMMRLCYTDDGKLKHSIPAIGMAEGIGIGMIIGMAMYIPKVYIAKRGSSH